MDSSEMNDDNAIVIQYIRDFTQNKLNSRVMKNLHRLIISNPKRAWRIIEQIINNTSDDSLISYIAASAIEDLLALHPFILDIIRTCINRKILEALDCVWKNRMTEETWNKLQLLIDEYYKDNIMKMQQLLIELGYDLNDECGNLGPKTQQAIRELRKKTGLPLESVEEVLDELDK